jgi:phosphate transport system substrate-binding protein
MSRIFSLLVVVLLLTTGMSVMAQDQTIAEIAAANPDFSTLIGALDAAGLTDVLNGEGPFTVFAPTNEAFAAIPETTLNYITSNPELLTRVLTYHVVSGEVMSADVTTMTAPSMEMTAPGADLIGSELNLVVHDAGVQVNGANVIQADIDASNGVIHAIDQVLIPPVELPEVDPLSVTGDIITAGSSTVFPLTEAVAEQFTDEGYSGNVTIDSIGTGAGFERFCVAGESDIANASRVIKAEETEQCAAINRTPVEFRVGTDALAVVVSAENDFVDSLTIEQLNAIYSATATTWADVNPEWPAEPIQLFSPGTDSGTFDYFVEVVFEKDEAPILGANPQLSEDDNTLVQGVEGSPYAIGYFGYAYYQANADQLRAVAIEGVEPSGVSVDAGAYPLSRPLFIYSTAAIMGEKPQVADFVNYYLTYVNDLIGPVGYFPANQNALNLARLNWLVSTSATE